MRRDIFFAFLFLLAGCDNEAERIVRIGTLDPDAVQFRDVERCPVDKTIWKGAFNEKNIYGGYTGFKSFFYIDGRVILYGDMSDADAAARDAAAGEAANNRCYGLDSISHRHVSSPSE